MRSILFLYLVIGVLTIQAQEVVIKGIALDSTDGRKRVRVVVNDTILKYVKNSIPTMKFLSDYSKNIDDLRDNYAAITNRKGKFKIRAKIKDSLTFSSDKHLSQKYLVSDLLNSKVKIILHPLVCEDYATVNECDEKPTRLVFIGKKIEVNFGERKWYCKDVGKVILRNSSKYKFKYKIVELISGSIDNDTISFSAYTHYGRPFQFENSDYALITLKKKCNEIVYQNPSLNVYGDKIKGWFVAYKTGLYNTIDEKKTGIKPRLIQLNYPIARNVNDWDLTLYPEPYYKVKDGNLYAIYGNTLNEYFELVKHKL